MGVKIYSLVVGGIDRLLNTGVQDEWLKLLNFILKKLLWLLGNEKQLKRTIVSSESEQLILSVICK